MRSRKEFAYLTALYHDYHILSTCGVRHQESFGDANLHRLTYLRRKCDFLLTFVDLKLNAQI
jgi:hypothetical protein